MWLEVEPVASNGLPKPPAEVFNHPSIEVIATPRPTAGLAEFFGETPGTTGSFNEEEWQQWKRIDPAGSNNLPLVAGNRPYLIKLAAGTAPAGIPVTGTARFFRPAWTPDRYNLVGFGLDGTPSFQAFFAPSAGKHPVAKIFRLNRASGDWQNVAPADAMTPGEAYWIFSAGPSQYMGPVSVGIDHAQTGALNFGGPADAVPVGSGVDALHLDLEEIVFTNSGSAPATPRLDLTTPGPGPGTLTLHVVRPAPDSLAYDRGSQVDSTPPEFPPTPPAALNKTVGPNETSILTLGARRLWNSGAAARTNLYRLHTGAGSSFWLPVTALNDALQSPADMIPASPAASVAGLWAGNVSINASTSITENGAPVRPAAAPAPVRVLLHSDASGAVHLLSQVTLMQTKSADPAVSPVPVLVVDQAKIPFFEGVRERNGKRVGVRIEAVTYDMPRNTDVAAQSSGAGDLPDMIVAESVNPATRWLSGAGIYPNRASVTPAAIDSFLLFRSVRPPALKEVYRLSVAVNGAIGAGKTVATRPGSVVLDPFHRSNPFRHGFHQNHPKGPHINRELVISFDPAQPAPDRLLGSYRETITGVMKSDLILTGTIELRRISAVAALDTAP